MKVGNYETRQDFKHFTYIFCLIWVQAYLVINNTKEWHSCNYAYTGKILKPQKEKKHTWAGLQHSAAAHEEIWPGG